MSAEGREIAFATLQVVGDQLDPTIVTAVLGLEPTFAVRKGERFRRGTSGRDISGRTGVWNLSTRDAVTSSTLQDHLDILAGLLSTYPGRLTGLRRLVQESGFRAGVSCFWFGPTSAVEPSVPKDFRELIGRFGGEIDTDFYRDDGVEARTAAE